MYNLKFSPLHLNTQDQDEEPTWSAFYTQGFHPQCVRQPLGGPGKNKLGDTTIQWGLGFYARLRSLSPHPAIKGWGVQ
jgi:hypothetical protein